MVHPLARGQQAHFDIVGYYKLKNAIPNNKIDVLLDSLEKECGDPELRFKTITSSDGQVQKLYGVVEREKVKRAALSVALGEKVMSFLTTIIGPNIVLVTNRHNHIHFNRLGQQENRIHRDILQPTRGLLSVLYYLEDSTLENGCTMVVPGSQHETRVGVPQIYGGGTWMDDHDDFAHLDDQAVPVIANKGDVLVFDGMLFHGAGINPTQRTRTTMTLGFRPHDELSEIDLSRNMLVSGTAIYRGNDR